MAPSTGSRKPRAPDHWLHINTLHVYPEAFSWVGSQEKEVEGQRGGCQSIPKGSFDDRGPYTP